MPVCAIVSFRLGLTDGVSIVADRWAEILADLGFEIVTVAGEGPVDRLVRGLGIGAEQAPQTAAVEAALGDADLVVVENLCTIPLNLPASRVVAEVLAGRPAILHHHDPPWQRDRFRDVTELPPDDAAWEHVTINGFTAKEFATRGIPATTIWNPFDTGALRGDREATRDALGVADDATLVIHPVRAIERKNVPAALALAAELDAVYWLMGESEEGYGPTLEGLLSKAECPVLRQGWPAMADAYAAADLVAFPSTWEGFGNPPLEAAVHRRPCCVGDYPAAAELRELGFEWFEPRDTDAMRAFLDQPDLAMIENNRRLALTHFSMSAIGQELHRLLERRGWLP